MLKRLLFAAVAVGMASGLIARADTIGQNETFHLTADGCTNGCGTGPTVFGTIVLTYTGTGVMVTETLNNNFPTTPATGSYFAETSGDTLAFILPNTSLTITSLTSGFGVVGGTDTAGTWTVNKASIHEPPFGNYAYAITCGGISCGPGASKTNPGPLSFTIGGVTLEDFSGVTSTYGDIFFSSDIIGPSGNTGDVGAIGPQTIITPTVPEPSSLMLLGTGVLGLAGVVRRRFGR